MESESVDWSDLPAELVSIISDCLEEGSDIIGIRSVCRSWRSSVSVKPIPNKISTNFPRRLPPWPLNPSSQICKSLPTYVIANAIYLARPLNNNRNQNPVFLISVEEPKAGKLRLRHPLTCKPIIGSKEPCEWSQITRMATSHSWRFSCGCSSCWGLSGTKLVFVSSPQFPQLRVRVGKSEAMTVFYSSDIGTYAIRNGETRYQSVATPRFVIHDIVNFNGCVYAIGPANVYVLDHTSTGLQWRLLNCVNMPLRKSRQVGNRFVVSDGDLYIVFTVCVGRDRCTYVLKMVMEGLNYYRLEGVTDLGDRVFFINRDCSFSVSAQQLGLPLPLVRNCILVVGSAMGGFCCSFHYEKPFSVLGIGNGKPDERRVLPLYLGLFTPPWARTIPRQLKRCRGKHNNQKVGLIKSKKKMESL